MSAARTSLFLRHKNRIDIVVLIFAAGILLGYGLFLPIMTVKKLWAENTYSVLSGIQALWDEKSYFLAAVLFFFSVIFPSAKIGAIFFVWFARLGQHTRERVIYWLEILGRWSMLDVFVTAIVIVITKFGPLLSAKPRSGIYVFGAAVLVSMVLTFLVDRTVRRSSF